MASSDNWTCPACQTVNGDQQTCSVCETPRAAQTAPTERVPQVPIVAAPDAPGQGQGPGLPVHDRPRGGRRRRPQARSWPEPAPGRRRLQAGGACTSAWPRCSWSLPWEVRSSSGPSRVTIRRRPTASVDREDEGPSTTEAKEASPTGAPKATSTLRRPRCSPPRRSPGPSPPAHCADGTNRRLSHDRADLGRARAPHWAIPPRRWPPGSRAPTSSQPIRGRRSRLATGLSPSGPTPPATKPSKYCRANDLYLANDCVALPVSQTPPTATSTPVARKRMTTARRPR